MPNDSLEYGSPKRILAARSLRPRRRFGQNFLIDDRFAARIACALPDDAFAIEIGGGTGTLTAALAERCRFVTSIEIDRDLAAILRERFADRANVAVIIADALTFDFCGELASQAPPRAVGGNLPYYLTTPLLERLLEASQMWESAVIMVQREYARRLAGAPGSKEFGSLSLFAGHYCTIEKLFDIGAAGLYPAPGVASSIVRLQPRADRNAGLRNEALLLWLIRAAFSHRRKMLANSVAAAIPFCDETLRHALQQALTISGLETSARAEMLSLDHYRRLANALDEIGFAQPAR
ncbi:MAG: ribosomal RNA small subunit methyltransferase A [Candidatus Eremiobacteraeota bacterium]|nr:ribosomal RNA small subunit methyltransferase A [Candidatus Eremiobacteraeota bacterium]MBC5826508.1 ribosomal RNA small subunit methyltransferase A [Candidatus Eremiobacteraeota bacterium]